MQNNPNFWQRLIAATPPFFKKLQTFGLGLVGLGTSLTQVNSVSPKITTVLISIGSTIAIISQFAVDQTTPLNITNNDDIK
jgi:hypothetical protein